MHALSDELASLAGAIRGHGDLASSIAVCPRYSQASALAIYSNNYRENLHEALAGAYPILVQLVGADFFRMMTYQYIALTPSQSGNLHLYGAQLPVFLDSFEAALSLPYLSDFARLEWACHEAYYAADGAPFNPLRLQELAESDYAHLVWQCHPACSVLHSHYPLFDIWQAHQPGADENFLIDLDSGGGNMLVSRSHEGVEVSVLTPATADWLHRIQAGNTLSKATESTLAKYSDFDLSATLAHLIARMVLIDFSLS